MDKEEPSNSRSSADLDRLVEVWKTVVGTQQHFNDLSMKVRSFGVTVLAAMITAAAVAIREDSSMSLPRGWITSLGSAVLVAALVIWGCFYFIDRWWYHELLQGAVRHGETIEKSLTNDIPEIGLAGAIRAASSKGKAPLRSNTRLSIYYAVVAALVLVAAIAAHISAN